MSVNKKETVVCPGCGEETEVTVWTSITADDSPDLKRDLLAGKINVFRCPVCSAAGIMPNPMLYHDREKRLMISLAPASDEKTAAEMYGEVVKTSEESGGLKSFEDYSFRFVFDYNSLLEKILIFDNGLNDKTIEVIKLMVLSQETEKSEGRACRFGKLENDVMEFAVYDFKEGKMYTSAVPLKTYTIIGEALAQSGVKPYSFGWERVDRDYASRLLTGINN